VSFLSGDVHCAAVGVLKTLAPKGKGKQNEIVPIKDWRYMVNVVTSESFRARYCVVFVEVEANDIFDGRCDCEYAPVSCENMNRRG